MATEGAAQSLTYPEAHRSGHVDVYHGVEIRDPYHWMEEMEAAPVRSWMNEQDSLFRSFVDGVAARDRLEQRLHALEGFASYRPPFEAGGRYFYTRSSAGRSQRTLYVQDGLEGEGHVLLDPDQDLEEDERLRGITVSPRGRHVVYYVSEEATRWREARLMDASGRKQGEVITGLHAFSGSVAWRADGTGYYYVRYETPARDANQQANVEQPALYYHALGTPQRDDRLIFDTVDHPDWLLSPVTTNDGRYLVLTIQKGSAPGNRVYYMDLKRTERGFTKLIDEPDAAYGFLGSQGDRFWFYTDLDAPRGRIIAIDVDRPARRHWMKIVPEAGETITGNSQVGVNAVRLLGDRLVVQYLNDAVPLVRVFDLEGTLQCEVDLPGIGAIWGGFRGRRHSSDVFYAFLSLTDPRTVYRLDLGTGKSTVFKRPDLAFNPDDFVIQRTFFESRDGTRVPLFISHKKGLERDGSHPAFMYGYGAFGWVAFPWYQPHIVAWMEMGGVYALPAVRGGGEYGEDWHQDGIGLNRQNAIDDYIAAGEWLIEHGYTSSERLVANGGSASGMLPASAMVQRPDLFGASVIDIPVLDMLRYPQFTGGSTWLEEFGSPDDPESFEILRSYSPYHNIEPGTCYPPTLMYVGAHDETTVPLHGYKFTARLQHAQPCDHPVLLLINREAGHSFGANRAQRARTKADQLAFLIRVLGLPVDGAF